MSTQQGFPNISAPLVDSTGLIQQAWLQLLISLWKRTGSGPGATSFISGDIKESAAPGVQDGWLVCDGEAHSRTTYSSLFGAIGTLYGPGDGSTTFNIPDYRGKSRVGVEVSTPLGTVVGSNYTGTMVGSKSIATQPIYITTTVLIKT